MSAKDVKFGDSARSQMLDGVNTFECCKSYVRA